MQVIARVVYIICPAAAFLGMLPMNVTNHRGAHPSAAAGVFQGEVHTVGSDGRVLPVFEAI